MGYVIDINTEMRKVQEYIVTATVNKWIFHETLDDFSRTSQTKNQTETSNNWHYIVKIRSRSPLKLYYVNDNEKCMRLIRSVTDTKENETFYLHLISRWLKKKMERPYTHVEIYASRISHVYRYPNKLQRTRWNEIFIHVDQNHNEPGELIFTQYTIYPVSTNN